MLLIAVFLVNLICEAYTSTFLNYNDSTNETNLYSDAFLNSFQLLTKYGYSPEEHIVETEDDYLLTLYRIPRKGPPVILVHGVTDSSDEWVVLGPKQSLAYQLADIGFDVWLFNSRGNRYSKQHKKQISQKEYWDFSFEEVGTRDLSASIDFILNVTLSKKIFYVGFSQGTTVFLVLCSLKPEYNDKIHLAILLAPVAWVNNIKYPLIGIASYNLKLFKFFTEGIGLYELIPFDVNKANSSLDCHHKYSRELCATEYFISFGLKRVEYLSKPVIVDGHVPAGTSAKTLLHYIQCYRSHKFQRYDYDATKNLHIYKSRIPPVYNVSLVTVPINIIASEIDWFSGSENVNILLRKLPNVKSFKMFDKSFEFSHLEFVYGSRVNAMINKPVVKLLSSQSKRFRAK